MTYEGKPHTPRVLLLEAIAYLSDEDEDEDGREKVITPTLLKRTIDFARILSGDKKMVAPEYDFRKAKADLESLKAEGLVKRVEKGYVVNRDALNHTQDPLYSRDARRALRKEVEQI